jgi:hypothetical protein
MLAKGGLAALAKQIVVGGRRGISSNGVGGQATVAEVCHTNVGPGVTPRAQTNLKNVLDGGRFVLMSLVSVPFAAWIST